MTWALMSSAEKNDTMTSIGRNPEQERLMRSTWSSQGLGCWSSNGTVHMFADRRKCHIGVPKLSGRNFLTCNDLVTGWYNNNVQSDQIELGGKALGCQLVAPKRMNGIRRTWAQVPNAGIDARCIVRSTLFCIFCLIDMSSSKIQN